MKWLKGKLAYIFMIGVYFHRLVDGLNDLRYEFYNASAGVITWIEFGKQIIPTLKYPLPLYGDDVSSTDFLLNCLLELIQYLAFTLSFILFRLAKSEYTTALAFITLSPFL